ncbi:MAG: J domain-containing protein [Acidobacteria bacterium]|nr:J domain-containing protein [Acidobacteriota bacterium]
MSNLYEILDISPKASQQDIRSAFRRSARMYHPDVNKSPTATDDFLRIARAYRILSDRRLRSLYDQGVLIDRDEYLRRKARQQMVDQYFDSVISELLRRDEEETRARQITVTTVATLFFSTFIIALLRPPIFESLGWIGRIICLLLFGLGLRELINNIRFSLKYYTFEDENTISLMRIQEVPEKPYTREEAWAFLIGGYLLSVGLGLLIGYLTGGVGGMGRDGNVLLSLLLLPPMFVFFVGRIRALGIFEIKKIETR